MIRDRVTLIVLYRYHPKPRLACEHFQGGRIEQKQVLAPIGESLKCIAVVKSQQGIFGAWHFDNHSTARPQHFGETTEHCTGVWKM
jgi:hypothetical protein